MAVLSDYTSGTISLANGSVIVTGTGTLFEVTRFREGDTLQIQNLTAVIASVDSDTQLTLTEPWTGTSIVDGPYRARQLADGTRVGTQAATLIELLGDGTLAGLAALGVEEGKAPVGGPAGQYVLEPVATDPNGSVSSLAALTLAARQILQTDGAGALTAITLAARQILQSDQNGALKAVALAANKLINTDDNGDILLSDISTLARDFLGETNGRDMWTAMGGDTGGDGTDFWIKLPNEWIFQAGTSVSASNDYRKVFPTTFPGRCLFAGLTNTYAMASNRLVTATSSAIDVSGFDIRCRDVTNGGVVQPISNVPLVWFAIGW